MNISNCCLSDIDFVCMFVKCGMPGCPEKNKQQIVNRSNGTGNRWPTCYHLSRSPKTSLKCFHATLKQFLYPPGNQYRKGRWMKIIKVNFKKNMYKHRGYTSSIYIILPHSNQNDDIFHPWISLRPPINDRLPCCSKLLRFRNCFRYKFLHCRGFLSIQMSGSECSGPPYAAWFLMLAGRGKSRWTGGRWLLPREVHSRSEKSWENQLYDESHINDFYLVDLSKSCQR